MSVGSGEPQSSILYAGMTAWSIRTETRPMKPAALVALLLIPSLVAAQRPDRPGEGVSFLHKAFDDALPRDAKTDAKALAERIDRIIEARLSKEGIKPAPPAGDGQFLRRLTLDLL